MAKRTNNKSKSPRDLDKDRTFLTVRLEMSPEEFGEKQLTFSRKLARSLDLAPSDIELLAYRPGCVDVDMTMPTHAAKQLDDAAREKFKDVDALKTVAREFKVVKVTPVGAIFSEAIIHFRAAGRSLTWLHLSDLHVKAADQKGAAAQDLVQRTFLEQLPDAMNDFSIDPDAVFVTGDVAFSGESAQYEQALSFFKGVRNALGKPDLPIIAVPGNHDVHRGSIVAADEERARKELRGHEAVEELLRQPQNATWRESLFKRLANFNAFTSKAKEFGQPELQNGEFFFYRQLEQSNIKIGIAGLNSAWRSSDDSDRNRLLLSQHQIRALEKALRGADLRIALVHHPVASNEWFAHFEVLFQRRNLHCFDFILNGHEHDPHAEAVMPGSYQRVAGGALYTNDEGYVNSFNAVRIDLDRGNATAFFWRFAKDKLVWVKDVESFPREGYEKLLLSPALKRRLGIEFGTAPPPGTKERQF